MTPAFAYLLPNPKIIHVPMKKIIAVMAVLMTAFCASAQESVAFRFGCVSYKQVLTGMAEYAQMESDLDSLKVQYDAELKAAEEEFNEKYETFLSEYSNYAPAIQRKRQSELEDLMRRNEQFRMESRRLLQQARDEEMARLRAKVDAAVSSIATQYSLAFVLNTDSDAVPFMNMSMAYNITTAVEEAVKR